MGSHAPQRRCGADQLNLFAVQPVAIYTAARPACVIAGLVQNSHYHVMKYQPIYASVAILVSLFLFVVTPVFGQGELPPPIYLPPDADSEPPMDLPAGAVIVSDSASDVSGITDPVMPDPIEVSGPQFSPPWYHPAGWFGPQWDGSLELGLNGQEGNSVSENFRLGWGLKRETQRTLWDTTFIYNKASNQDLLTANNWLLLSNIDFKLKNPRWTAFTKLGLEFDDFKAFDLRLFLNSGLGYYLIKTPITTLRSRFGAGASREFGAVDEEWKPEAVFGIDFEHELSKRQKIKVIHDYYPNWEDFSDYRMVTDASWQLLIDTESNLSLKIGALNRYDSTPNGAKHNDLNYSALLLWAF